MEHSERRGTTNTGSYGVTATSEKRMDHDQDFFSTHVPSRPVTSADAEPSSRPATAQRRPRKIVLCFDGTGNKFHGDDSDSNILKIYRMLDRTASDQCEF